MSTKLAGSFAIRNLKNSRHVNVPFVISGSIMLMMFYMMAALLYNRFVLERHADLILLVRFGVVVIWIFATVFIMYGNRFLMGQRNKELALYGILGLEKKHIRRILLFEEIILFAAVLLIGIAGGYVVGQLSYVGLGKLLNGGLTSAMTNELSVKGLTLSAVFVLFLFVVVYLKNILVIKNTSPVALLSMQYKGESEPKVRYVLLITGILFMAGGYWIALTTKGTLNSLKLFFAAVFLVLFGTYFLFTSLSIFVLKMQRKNRKYYYRPTHFLSISGMLYRMKSNAVSLASIAILSTSVLAVVSTTYTIYGSMDHVAQSMYPMPYRIESSFAVTEENKEQYSRELIEKAKKGNELSGVSLTGEPVVSQELMVPARKIGSRLIQLEKMKLGEKNTGDIMYLIFMPLSSYNSLYQKQETLSDGEALVSSNFGSVKSGTTLEMMGKEYHIREVKGLVPGNLAIEAYTVVVPTFEEVEQAAQTYKSYDLNTKEMVPLEINSTVWWNADEAGKAKIAGMSSYLKNMALTAAGKNMEKSSSDSTGSLTDSPVAVDEATQALLQAGSYDDELHFLYTMDGGFLYLGIMIGALFLVGTIMMIYYKQISEGIQDRHRYQIMKKVGLPDELIRKTSSYQVVWMFFLPLAVACIHAAVASKILYQLTMLFGAQDLGAYIRCMAVSMGVFAVAYFIVYRITSRVYYRFVR